MQKRDENRAENDRQELQGPKAGCDPARWSPIDMSLFVFALAIAADCGVLVCDWQSHGYLLGLTRPASPGGDLGAELLGMLLFFGAFVLNLIGVAVGLLTTMRARRKLAPALGAALNLVHFVALAAFLQWPRLSGK